MSSMFQTTHTSPSKPDSVVELNASTLGSIVENLKAKLSTLSIPASHHQPEKNPVLGTHGDLLHANPWFESASVNSTACIDLLFPRSRHYKTAQFTSQLLTCLRTLDVPSWSNTEITRDKVLVYKVSGSLTNAVFFVSCPSIHETPTVLLRIYGPSSGSLISRPKELHTLHVLSSQYNIGPRVYGTFENGRIEEYFESTTLTAQDIRDPTISRWIAASMADFHSVDISAIEISADESRTPCDLGVIRNVAAWLEPARAVLAIPTLPEADRRELDLERFRADWDKYMSWLSTANDVNSGSRRVFSHNDTQYGNLLRLTHVEEGLEEHCQIIVVDFEYAAPNPAAYDIANHFHEWTANYHSATPHLLDFARYPNADERRNFYTAYLNRNCVAGGSGPPGQALTNKLDEQVRYWSPASHAMWAIWGIVQAREDVEGNVEQPEFDYIGYAKCRITAFRHELQSLGVLSSPPF
ncbi:hypothetical protein AX17_000454 [Amanita inopinata Kibby_2008]|nr:hypothetical protein AX17_000454 [Amanita inopinata Kibby_2008]